jgi:PTS hybrid protein
LRNFRIGTSSKRSLAAPRTAPAGRSYYDAFVAGTVGIVVVSHSERLALGVQELLTQLGVTESAVAAAGGAEHGGVGTSAARVAAGIERVDAGSGVVILADLGSAVLTARLVLDDAGRDDLRLVDAPLVEGAVAAAVTAAGGGDLAAVVGAAEEARTIPKF